MSLARLTIPQPCAQSWDAMTPAVAGRHCAACQKTVVDFTLKTDAEILAYLAGAAAGRTCGRFAAGQLERPLQRAASAAPAGGRWRAWLAAAVAVWGLREGIGNDAAAQAPTAWRARYWGGPVPAAPLAQEPGSTTLAASAAPDEAKETSFVIRGVVRDSSQHLGLPGVTVLLKNTLIGISTNADGTFELTVPAQHVMAGTAEIQLSYVGYEMQFHRLPVGQNKVFNRFYLEADTRMLGEVVICQIPARKLPPAPWHLRAIYPWGKYWLTRPFRSN